MCGIIAGISDKVCKVLLDGLKQLQNRGYDSAGIATLSQGLINEIKSDTISSDKAANILSQYL